MGGSAAALALGAWAVDASRHTWIDCALIGCARSVGQWLDSRACPVQPPDRPPRFLARCSCSAKCRYPQSRLTRSIYTPPTAQVPAHKNPVRRSAMARLSIYSAAAALAVLAGVATVRALPRGSGRCRRKKNSDQQPRRRPPGTDGGSVGRGRPLAWAHAADRDGIRTVHSVPG